MNNQALKLQFFISYGWKDLITLDSMQWSMKIFFLTLVSCTTQSIGFNCILPIQECIHIDITWWNNTHRAHVMCTSSWEFTGAGNRVYHKIALQGGNLPIVRRMFSTSLTTTPIPHASFPSISLFYSPSRLHLTSSYVHWFYTTNSILNKTLIFQVIRNLNDFK